MDFRGKVVLVTGGVEKAGKHFAFEYAKAGADLVVSHYNMSKQAKETCLEIESYGHRCVAIEADNSNVLHLQNLVKEIKKEFGRLDVILHNASNFNNQRIDEITESIWDSSMNIILKGAFFLSQAAAPLMLENGGGKMLAIIGNSYYENWPNFVPHSVAKVGLAKLMEMLAVAYSPYIQCNAICPASFLDSEEGNEIMDSRGENLSNLGDLIKIKDVLIHRGNVNEVAELILFLTGCSSYINGAVIPIDSGKHLI